MEKKEIALGAFQIGPNHPPFVVAEISANHNGSLDRALEIVKSAKASGVHAVKLQTYTPDTMTLDVKTTPFTISDPKSLWYGKTLYELYKEAHTPWEWHETIFNLCRRLDLIFFSTPFDASAVDFLESLDVPCYKIASLEITDLPLIKKAASTKKPLFISTGAASLQEIRDAVSTAHAAGCSDLVLLKCTSAYPAPPTASNLRTIPDLAKTFDVVAGLSDHTPGIGSSIAAVALGAAVIEKHLALSRKDGGVDAAFSLEPSEMALLTQEAKRAWESLGRVYYGPDESEKSSLLLRRSLYFVKNLKKGHLILPEDVRAIRPGFGLSPAALENVIGLELAFDVSYGDPVTREALHAR